MNHNFSNFCIDIEIEIEINMIHFTHNQKYISNNLFKCFFILLNLLIIFFYIHI